MLTRSCAHRSPVDERPDIIEEAVCRRRGCGGDEDEALQEPVDHPALTPVPDGCSGGRKRNRECIALVAERVLLRGHQASIRRPCQA